MRYSHQRETILLLVRGTDSHPTADWIFEQVRRDIPNVSLGTVYRNLNQLADAGLILRLHDDGHTRYDGNLERHDHFRCDRCGRMFDVHVPHDGIARFIAGEYNFSVSGYSMEINGVCRECQLETEEA